MRLTDTSIKAQDLRKGDGKFPYWSQISKEGYESSLVVFDAEEIKVYGLFDYDILFHEEKLPPFLKFGYDVIFGKMTPARTILQKITDFIY
jgi:hypothetical protein